MLASYGRKRTLISSTGINDLSKKIYVGADEMLLNAINKTNRKSGSYVFLDQSFEKEVGQLEWLSPTKTRRTPQFYFRGAITQLDTNTINDEANLSLDLSNAPHPLTINGGALKSASPSINRGVSIVSVDIHLVSYPDKIVLRGGSVANSMVVTSKTFGTGSSGLIKLTGYNLSITFNRVESIGQAVRNLVELGVIELLGRHAKVPYGQCLNIEPANEKLENAKRNDFLTTPNSAKISQSQDMLKKLGYLKTSPTGLMDRNTHAAISKFQADKGLIATGNLSFATYSQLLQIFKGYPVNGRNMQTTPKTKAPLAPKAQGQFLTLKSHKSRYMANDTLVIKLKSKSAGYIACFHQAGSGKITQILPHDPKIRLKINSNYRRNLPNNDDGFELKFEQVGLAENILCTLQDLDTNGVLPFGTELKAFAAIPVKNLRDIPVEFSKMGHLSDWAVISRAAVR